MTGKRGILSAAGIIISVPALLLAQAYLAGPFSVHSPTCLPFLRNLKPSDIGLTLTIAGGLLLAVSAWYHRRDTLPGPEQSPTCDSTLIVILLLLAIPLRLYQLAEVPYGAHNDEIVKGMQVLGFFKGDAFKPFYLANKEFLFFYMLTPFIWFGGPTIGALRALPFCCGLLTVWFSWLLFRRLWGSHTAWAASGLLAVGLWPGQSCHICERLNAAPMFTAATLYFLISAIQTRRWTAWLATAVSMACGMWTFPTFRLIPFAVIGYIFWSLIRRELSLKSDWTRILAMLLLFAILVTAPLEFDPGEAFTVFYTRHEHDFKIARTPDQIRMFAYQLLRSFNVDAVHDMSFTSFEAPLLWWPLGAFFLTGLINLLIRLPQNSSVFGIVWLGAALMPAVVSEPVARRLTAAQPLVFGLTGLGLWFVIRTLCPICIRWKTTGYALIGGVIVLAGIRDFEFFRQRIAPVWHVAWEDYWIVRAGVDNFDRFEIHMDWIEEEAELPYRFLTYPKTGNLDAYIAEPPQFSVPFRFAPEQDFMYLFRNISENTEIIPLLTGLYPRGVLVLHQNEQYPRGYYSFTMTRRDLMDRQGVIATFRDSSASLETSSGVSEKLTLPLNSMLINQARLMESVPDTPRKGLWDLTGILLADRTGRQDFLLETSGEASFMLDGRVLHPDDYANEQGIYREFLTAEPHEVTIRVPESSSAAIPELKLLWHEPGFSKDADGVASWVEIPSNRWLKPPVPETLQPASITRRADFQFALTDTRRFPHPSGGRTYDIARLNVLPDGTFIGNCWHYQTMVVLDAEGRITREWKANLMEDPQWMLRFDFDVGADGNIYLTGDTRNRLLVASADGQFLRRIDLPAVPQMIDIDSAQSALVLFPGSLNRISLTDGSILNTIGSIGENPESFKWPVAIVSDRDQRVYVADQAFNRIQIYRPDGAFERSLRVPGPMSDNFGMTIDDDGNILVPHFLTDYICVIAPDGAILTGHPDFQCDPLDSRQVFHPRYVIFPTADSMWVTNADALHQFSRVGNPEKKTGLGRP